MTAIQNRYEFVYLFDVANGNPNGDPDNGNMPRLETDTQKGLITDVSLKRKVRNYVELLKGGQPPYAIYMQERSVLNNQHQKAYDALGVKSVSKKLPREEAQARELTAWMCANYFDIRAFGAVMTTEVNAGQVRGPIQMTFAQSVDPVLPQEISITRSSVTNERDADKERTMGRKYIVPYGLYRSHGFVSASLAGDATKGTGLSEEDLEIFFDALANMFDHDRSAARGEMSAQRLIVFKHAHPLGNAQAQSLFKRVSVVKRPEIKTTRSYDDYEARIDRAGLPDGVEIIERL
ncbi:type I-C CRISPR-associated protein Cas7/Csd2 [Mesorhizobium sp. Root157]|uniref:type I-C CRISPR-associated protein Cas7/Csd2 n=1 Tax=Mesorhizobium sp. Root157 TaxID=1736477 RepID=UPI0006F3B3AC|nr:type I-C CRISPR-associated protein Cas7/Csd2 [Mesorhizobium sp. Root157]KQZ84770.1 type I-C CRISPR-associated protein Cas7/Csd2 [Mesorhizobium sp. Root157]